jgi:hypothetical protein
VLLVRQILAGGAVYLTGCAVYVIGISREYRNIKEILKNLKL